SGCEFGNCSLSAITNPGEGWVVENSNFEGFSMPAAIAADYTSVGQCRGLSFIGNWLGDATAPSTPWINPSPSYLQFAGAVFSGNAIFQDSATGSKASIQLGSSYGVVISGNVIGTIDFSKIRGLALAQSVIVHGNRLLGINTQMVPFFKGLEV